MPTKSTRTWMDNQRKGYIDPERPPQMNRPKELQAHNVPTNDVENINSTNKGRGLWFINKLWIVLWGTERIPQRIQRHRRTALLRTAHPQREQDQTEKSSYGLNWQQKGIWNVFEKLDNKLPQNVHKSDETINFIEKTMKTWKVEWTARRESLVEAKNWRGIFQGDAKSSLLSIIGMMPLNNIFNKRPVRYKLCKSQEKIKHLIYMDGIKLFGKKKFIWKLCENIQSGHRDRIWHRKMCHAGKEKR